MREIAASVDRWFAQGQAVALATVVETWGSSPRPAGAKMAITQSLSMVGSVSGGCVETAVAQAALECLARGSSQVLSFGVSDETAWDVGLSCGGKIIVFVEPLDRTWWPFISQAVRDNHLVVTAAVMNSPTNQKVTLDIATGASYLSDGVPADLREALLHYLHQALDNDYPVRQHIAELDVLIEVIHPQPKLIMVGGTHIAMTLQYFARQLGFQTLLVDPRQAFATPERFPAVDEILPRYPDKAFSELSLDSETYIAILSHDPKIDDPAICAALRCPVAYIGVLSSRAAHQQRIERLKAAGIDPSLLAHSHADWP